jgi:hypothetical protein
MDGEHGFPRRKRPADGRTATDSQTASPRRAGDRSRGIATREALDVARYAADLTAQIEAMALAADLDLLAYFIGMARAEAELFVRTNAEAGREPGPSDEAGLAGHEAEDDKSFD